MDQPRNLADLKTLNSAEPRRNVSPGTPQTYMYGTQFALLQFDDPLSEDAQHYIQQQAQWHANFLNTLNLSFPNEKPESLTGYTGAKDAQRTMAHYVALSERGEDLPGGITGRDIAIMKRNPGVARQVAAARQDIDDIGTVNSYMSGVQSALPAGLSPEIANDFLRGSKGAAEFVDGIITEFAERSVLDKGSLSAQRGAADTYERMADIVLAHQRNEKSAYEILHKEISPHDVQVMSLDPNVRALVEGPTMLEAAHREIQGISGLSNAAKEQAFRLVQTEDQRLNSMFGLTGPQPHFASDAKMGQEMAQTALIAMVSETQKPGYVSGDTELANFFPVNQVKTLSTQDMTALQKYAPVSDMFKTSPDKNRPSVSMAPTT